MILGTIPKIESFKPKSRIELDFSPQQKVYYANHGSHGDFLLVWISLPRRWRIHTRPVAGSDYWLTGRIRPSSSKTSSTPSSSRATATVRKKSPNK